MMDQAQQLRDVVKKRSQSSQNARVVTVTSGKGGVGKSNVAVNLAVQLKKAGKRVIIFDADIGLANVEIMFGTIPEYTLSDVIYHGKSMREVITTGPLDIGFISGGSGIIGMNHLSLEQIFALVQKIEELNDLADFIIIDTGAGISDQVMQFVVASPEIMLVSTPDPSSLTDTYSLLKALYRNGDFHADQTTIHVVSNKVAAPEEGQAVYDKLSSVVAQFLHGKLNYLGMIPQDQALERAVRQQRTVSLQEPGSRSAKAFEVLAGNLVNGTHDQAVMRWGISQMFSNFLSNRKQDRKEERR